MKEKLIPGTVTPYGNIENNVFSIFTPMITATGGLSLAQVCSITGLEGSTIQNWVKRGFIANPIKKKYFERHLARIFLFNALRDGMQFDKIISLFSYINGDVEDESDDNIRESELFDYFCNIVKNIDIESGISFNKIENLITDEIEDYKGPFKDSYLRLFNTLLTMTFSFVAGRYKQETESFYSSFMMKNK